MKKLLTLLVIFTTVLLTGCVDDMTNLEVVYKLDKQVSYTSNQVFSEISKNDTGIFVYIVLSTDFSLDDYKSKITPDMSAQEVDKIIQLAREVGKKHFGNFNEAFVEKQNLRKLSGDVEYASYGPFITIHYSSLSLNEKEIEQLIYLSNLEDVEYIEFQVNK